ncbi:MAG: hypothetical protein IJH04_08545, partial [Eggerthellaceae bacterium]|nr:hypothetical protein [Eggerthellaceae bacterium]
MTFTPAPQTAGDYTSFATTDLKGEWIEAQYTVKYKKIGDTGVAAGVASDFPSAYTPSEYDTGATLSFETADVSKSGPTIAQVPTITFSLPGGNAQYEVVGWLYSTDNGASWAKSGDNKYDVLESPVGKAVSSDDFVFAPIIQVRSYTVNFEGGPYAANAIDQVTDVTTYQMKYGATLSGSIAANVKSQYGFDSNSDVPLANNYFYLYQQTAKHGAAETSNWTFEDATSQANATGGTVHGNITYVWNFPKCEYTIHFMGLENTDVAADATAAAKAATWTGAYTGYDPSTDPDPKINYDSSVFKNMASETALSGYLTAGVLTPTKPGATFKGWIIGDNQAPSKTAETQAKGTDFKVQDVRNPSYNAGDIQNVYIWAVWENEPVTLTYHNNLTNEASGSTHFANEGQGIATWAHVSEAAVNHDGAVGSLHAYDNDFTLNKHDTLGADFTPAGYTFKGWSELASADSVENARKRNAEGATLIADGAPYEIGSGDKDLYAVYEA